MWGRCRRRSSPPAPSTWRSPRTTALVGPLPDSQLQRGAAELERFADAAFEVPQIGLRQLAVDEERERRRVGRTLQRIEHTHAVAGRLALLRVGDHAVHIAGGHPAVILHDGLLQDGPQLVDTLAAECRDLQNWRVAHEVELALQIGLDLQPRLWVVEQIPLVEDDNDRAPGSVDALCQALILAGDAVGGVDQEQSDVASVEGTKSTHH